MYDTRNNQHQMIKSDNPSDKISMIKEDSKSMVPLHETDQGMNHHPSYLSLNSESLDQCNVVLHCLIIDVT